MSYPKYPSYKDSGVEWLGKIPATWEEKRLKFTVTLRNDKVEAKLFTLPYLGLENIESSTGRLTDADNSIDPEGIANTYYTDDVLFGKLRPYLAKVYHCDRDGICTSELLVLKPKKVLPSFLKYFLLANEFIKIVDSSTYGAKMPRASWEFIGNMPCLIPLIDEQNAIVDFLDQETAKIDTLITKQQQLIETLQEKRQTIISYVVTKGLNPHAPLKDSGIEWIGRVPTHWPVMRNKVVFREVDERSTSGDEELLTVSHITGVTPRSEKNVNMFLAESLIGYKKCRQGDLIINTMWAWMGALGLTQYEGVVSPSYNVYRLRNKSIVNPKYLDFLYRTPAHIVEINRYSKGVWESRMRLYPDAFFTMQIALPPREEQDAIVDYLGKQLKLMDALEAKCQEAIELLQERRTSLISAAVTGKIDVRAYGNHEP